MWVFAIRMVERALNFGSLMVIARILAPEDFGVMAIGLIAIETLELFSDPGFKQALVQRTGDIDDYLDTAWTVGIGRGFLLGALLVAVSPLVGRFFASTEAAVLLRVLAISPVLKGFTNSHIVFFARELEFDKGFYLHSGGAVAQALVAVVVALGGGGIWALVAGLLAGNAARVVLSFVLIEGSPRLRFSSAHFGELFAFGRWILGSKVVVFLSTQGDDLLVGKLLGTEPLGYYRLAYRISNAPATEIAHLISTVTFPAYAKLQGDLSRLRRAFLQTFELTTVVSFLVGGLILVFADDLVGLVLGPQWAVAVPLVRVLAVYGVMRSMGASFGPVFQAIGRPDLSTKIQIFNLAVMLAAIYPMMSRWGTVGAAGAVTAASLASAPINFWLILRATGCRRMQVLSPVLRSVLFLSLSVGAVAVLTWSRPSTDSPVAVVLLVLLACAVYGGLSLVYWKRRRSEMWQFVVEATRRPFGTDRGSRER
jgi:lipopolysaccharide exporter